MRCPWVNPARRAGQSVPAESSGLLDRHLAASRPRTSRSHRRRRSARSATPGRSDRCRATSRAALPWRNACTAATTRPTCRRTPAARAAAGSRRDWAACRRSRLPWVRSSGSHRAAEAAELAAPERVAAGGCVDDDVHLLAARRERDAIARIGLLLHLLIVEHAEERPRTLLRHARNGSAAIFEGVRGLADSAARPLERSTLQRAVPVFERLAVHVESEARGARIEIVRRDIELRFRRLCAGPEEDVADTPDQLELPQHRGRAADLRSPVTPHPGRTRCIDERVE